MAVSDEDESRVARLLLHDVETTIGPGWESFVRREASHVRREAPLLARDHASYAQTVVDGVQQHFHDAFVDTSWPACPRHPNHPLWYLDGEWWCERDNVPIARLGEIDRSRL